MGVYAHAVQHDDGSIASGDPFFEGPRVSVVLRGDHGVVDTDITLSADSARRMADVIVMAADELDSWSAAMTETPLPLLQARLSEITKELLRRGISIEEQCSRVGLANAEELWTLLGDAR